MHFIEKNLSVLSVLLSLNIRLRDQYLLSTSFEYILQKLLKYKALQRIKRINFNKNIQRSEVPHFCLLLAPNPDPVEYDPGNIILGMK